MAKHTLAQQVFCLLVQEERSKKFWRPEIAIWRLKILVQSPVGANIKKFISDPVKRLSNLCVPGFSTLAR